MGEMIFAMIEYCPLCGRNSNYHHYSVQCIPDERTIRETDIDEIAYVICECGLIFQWWPMTQKTLVEYYKYQYRKTLGAPEVTERNTKEETIRANRILEFIDGAPNNVLDIGSSTGTLLSKLQDMYKCSVTGIEPGDKFREYSQSLGLNVLSGIECLNGNLKYDLVTIIHVLEHFVEPMGLLEKVRGLMAESGKSIIEVPLLDYRLPHPIVFTEETFKTMLNKAGFTIARLVADKDITAEVYIDT